MAVLRIPLPDQVPWYTFSITLEGQSFGFEMCLNTRANRWMLSLRDPTGALVVASIVLLIERDLLRPYRTYAVPKGALVVLDDTGAGQQPTAGSFLRNHTLYYQESTT